MNIHTFMDNLFYNPDIKIEDMKKGLTNQNFSLDINGERFVLRTPRYDSENIVHRHHETLALEAIKDEDIDVETIYYDEDSGYKVTRYIENALDYAQYQGEDKIERTALLMKKFHSINKKINIAFDPKKRYEHYRSFVTSPLYQLTSYEDIFQHIQENSEHICLCHNDWVEGNILFDKEKTYLIDYEYAADNDPLFDVMSFITENQIVDETLRERFYRVYFDEITPEIRRELFIWENVHNLLWCMWAMMMWEHRHEDIYQSIAKDKYEALQHSYQAWIQWNK
ncbi:phosphotransferase [Amedibacillus sp. YH-ame6]